MVSQIFRIYTEEKNKKAILRLVAERFESFTVQHILGYYRRKPEKSIVIEIVGGKAIQIKRLADSIRKMNGQKSVLILTVRGQSKTHRA